MPINPINPVTEQPIPPVHDESLLPLTSQPSAANNLVPGQITLSPFTLAAIMLGLMVITTLLFYRRGFLMSNKQPDSEYVRAIDAEPNLSYLPKRRSRD